VEKNWQSASRKKQVDPKELEALTSTLRSEGKTIATLNGSFDLLHAGHLHIIFEASKKADALIVCLNTDSSIKRYKSPSRPIIPLKFRVEMMSALFFVDYVTWFSETDPIEILSKIKPDVHVNGAEYGENCLEAEAIKSFGGKIHVVDLIDGLSTSNILKKVQQCAL